MFEIVTDSTCDIEDKYLEEIMYVPLYIIYRDQKIKAKLDNEFKQDFYRNMYRDLVNLKTSQPSVQDFIEVFKKSEHKDILVILLSSKLSGTYNVANIAKKFVKDKNIIIFDSKQSSIGLGLLVKVAIEYRNKGFDIYETKKELENIKVRTYIYLSDIKYLVRSGRLSIPKGLFLRIINKKPLLYLDDGSLKLHRLVNNYKEAIEFGKNKKKIYFGGTIDYFDDLPDPKILVSPIVAINTGPGVGVSYIDL